MTRIRGEKATNRSGQFHITAEMGLRIIADGLMINAALLFSLAAYFIYTVVFGATRIDAALCNHIFWTTLRIYAKCAGGLTLVCLVVFYLSGFYTYGRAYTGRYKALVVAQAVSLGYLLFAFLLYFFRGFLTPGRGVWVLAWILSATMLIAARLWSLLWRRVMRVERRLVRGVETQRVRAVLVIGGGGYIGSALLPKLLDRGYRVRVLDLMLYGMEPIQQVLGRPHLELIQADFRQVDTVVEAMRDMDAVIHLGAIVGDPACALDEELTIEVNLMATRMIAEVAKASGVGRFIFASTCSVYGASDEILDEHSQLRPVSLYARSKIASERVLMSMAGPTFAPTCLRFGTIYGVSGRTRFDLVVNLLTAKAVVERMITVSNGGQWRPFLHVEDAAIALLKTLERPIAQVNRQVLNVGSNSQNYTIQQVAEIIHKLAPGSRLINTGFDGERRNYRVDFTKIQTTLGFEPQWSIERGISQVIEALRSGQVSDYRDSKYSNFKFLAEEGHSKIHPVNGWAGELIREPLAGQGLLVNVPDLCGEKG